MSDLTPFDFEVDNPKIRELLNEIAHDIGARMPEGWGFGLFIFRYGANGQMFWLSSANREDMLNALSEYISRRSS